MVHGDYMAILSGPMHVSTRFEIETCLPGVLLVDAGGGGVP
jgi:hypothetical protein